MCSYLVESEQDNNLTAVLTAVSWKIRIKKCGKPRKYVISRGSPHEKGRISIYLFLWFCLYYYRSAVIYTNKTKKFPRSYGNDI